MLSGKKVAPWVEVALHREGSEMFIQEGAAQQRTFFVTRARGAH